jgi:two-component system sensor histidine kinase YesM
LKIDKKLFLVSTVTSEESYLRFVSVIPFNEVMNESQMFDLIAFTIILLNSIFLFIGTIFITRLITVPIKKLIESMKKVEVGEFSEVYIQSGDDEIGELRDGYNAMISEIRNLIQKIMIEQKIKRKAELNILQEQIKPHFLYNSLDAIAYMAVTGKGEEAYNLIMALSNYYRTSLSKGSEVITISNEVEIVRNYLTIQKVRYPNMFSDEYEIDESVSEVKIVKLILQPLVENALYHGIKPKGESGNIKISIKKEDKCIKLSVEDDGVGMNEEKLREINSSELEGNISSFGLRGTIERLKIFYGRENIYEITSREGYGTKINITLPINLEDSQT